MVTLEWVDKDGDVGRFDPHAFPTDAIGTLEVFASHDPANGSVVYLTLKESKKLRKHLKRAEKAHKAYA